MFVTGSIALNERENVLVVPYDAVLRTIDRYYVYQVVDGERVVLRAEETDTSASLFDALAALQEKGELRFSYEAGEYGAFLTQINGHTAAGNEFWAVYTTLGEYGGVRYSDEAYGTYHYGETQLASASYGVSSLPLVEGMLYAVALSSY